MSTQPMQPAAQFMRKRRLAAKKKREYARLCEEYERIKELEDRTIEKKMRQVRLNRLFREIEEIKERTAQQVRRQQERGITKPKTPEELRKEAIQRSKQLGIEYSKMNALLYNSFGHYLLTAPKKKRQKREISGYEKRIRYGNAISRHNYVQLLQMQTAQQKRGISKFTAELSSELSRSDGSRSDLQKSEQLRSRVVYGNTQSYINMLKIAQHQKRRELKKSKSASSTPRQKPNSSDDESEAGTARTRNTDVTEDTTGAAQLTDESLRVAAQFAGDRAQATALRSVIELALKALQNMNMQSAAPELNTPDTSQKDEEVPHKLCAIPSEMQLSEYYDEISSKRVNSSDSLDDNTEAEVLWTKNVYQSASHKTVQELQVPLTLGPAREDALPEKLLPASTSVQLGSIFKSTDKTLDSEAKQSTATPSAVSTKPTDNLYLNKAGVLEKIFETTLQNTVREQLMSNKIFRTIFEH